VTAGSRDLPVDERVAVVQRYGRVVIATVAEDAVDDVEAVESAGLTVARRRGDVDEDVWESLGRAERLALDAYWLRHSQEYRRGKDDRPGQGASWNHPDFTPPDPPQGVDLDPAAGLNDRLRGSVGLALVIVSGPGDLAFTNYQREHVVAEVQSGLRWLGNMWQLQRVTFEVDIYVPTITAPADPGLPPQKREALWRDPAMTAIGRGTGPAAVRAFAESLKTHRSTDSAYVAFFTHYPLQHFAYAVRGYSEVVVQYENDNWGPYLLDGTFAHETGHIFGAPDEYEPCECATRYGYYAVPNHNCASCPGRSSSCVMKGPWFSMCAWTPRHLGVPVWWVNGDNYTASTPVVVDGFIYYRGTNDYLYRVRTDGTDGLRIGDDKTSSTPFVTDGVIYYRGTNNYLYRVDIDGTNGSVIGDNKTSSTPFVTDRVIYYQGTNNYLYRVDIDGTNGSVIGDNKTSSAPFVSGGVIYYRGTNNKLYRVRTDGSDGELLHTPHLSSTPFVADDVVYFQGDELVPGDRLYMVNLT